MKVFKKLTVTIIVLSVSFLLIVAYSVKRSNVSIVESGLGTTFSTVQGFFYKINYNIEEFLGFVFNFSNVKSENEKLKEQNSELKKKALLYDSLKKENDELRKEAKFESDHSEYDYLGANIIQKSGGNLLDYYTIDRGSKDGIKKGMVVLNADGLIGKVQSVYSNTAMIETICSQNITVAAQVKSTGDNNCIIRGYIDSENKNEVQLLNLPLNSNIKEGDVILTSGLGGGYYPKNIQIGKVIEVDVNSGRVEKNAIVEPYVDFNKLDKVTVVIPKDKSEIKY